MSTITAGSNVTGLLLAPQASGSDPMAGLDLQAGIFGGIDAVVSALTGFSPLKEWVFKPLAGDWSALQKGADAWMHAGKAARELARAVDSLPGQVGDEWQGATALKWANANGKAVALLDQLPDRCDQMATTCDAIAQAAEAVAGLIADVLGQLSETIVQAMVEAAIPVAGWIAESETAAQLAIEITESGTRITAAITKFAALLQRLAPILEELLGIGEEIMTIASKLTTLAPKVIVVAKAAAGAAGEIKAVYNAFDTIDKTTSLIDHVKTYTTDGVDILTTAAGAYSAEVKSQ